MSLKTKDITYEEYLEMPEIKQRYEIIDGEMIFMAPGPTPKHQMNSRNLFLSLYNFVASHQLGEVLYAPLDVLIQQKPLCTRQPDLLFISKERSSIIGKQMIEGGPDLVVEILSPSNTRADVEKKLKDYAVIDVRECWLVSSEARTIEILKLSFNRWERLGLYGTGDRITSEVLPGLCLKVDEVIE